MKEIASKGMNDSLATNKKKFIAVDVFINAVTLVLFFNPSNPEGDCWEVNLGKTRIFSDAETLKKQ